MINCSSMARRVRATLLMIIILGGIASPMTPAQGAGNNSSGPFQRARYDGPLPHEAIPKLPINPYPFERHVRIFPKLHGSLLPGPALQLAQRIDSNFNSGKAVEAFMTRGIPRLRKSTKTAAITAFSTKRRSVVSQQSGSAPNVTGVNTWWSYESGDIPGIGRWMVNNFNQNLLTTMTDFAMKYRGVDFAFRRTYNSYSGHNFTSADGSTEIGQYGNGWTNTFDVHMSTNNCPNTGVSFGGFYGFSVFDSDGARYDYCFNSSGTLVPPPGMQGVTLVANPDGGSFYWTKKDGTKYWFYSPYYSGSSAAYSGRLVAVFGSNNNSSVDFTYAWSPDASSSSNLTEIEVATDEGAQADLYFSNVGSQRLLTEIVRPDGLSITYAYDGSGNLTSVTKPGPTTGSGMTTENYGGYQSFLAMYSPRYVASGGTDGGYVAFQSAGYSNNTLSPITKLVQSVGVMNPGPSNVADGTNTYFQSGPATGVQQYKVEVFAPGSCSVTVYDTDGHEYIQNYNCSGGQPTTRQDYTGSVWLNSSQTYDTSNNLVSTVDPRNLETDHAYDSNGNEIAIGYPSSTTTQGTFRPVWLYDYDQFNNVVAVCDPVTLHNAGFTWNPPYSGDTNCSTDAAQSNASIWKASFSYPSYAPYGELAQITSPLGYTTTYAYATSGQAGTDYGLPTSITGQPITQLNNTSITPTTTATYDNRGDLLTYSKGLGSKSFTYNSMGLRLTITDEDGVVTATNTFNNDESMATSQNVSEAFDGQKRTYVYDDDGDLTSETTCYGYTPANPVCHAASKWYDGEDRLIEVQQPADPNVDNGLAGYTRYIYDLSQGGKSASFGGGTYSHGNGGAAYGNLLKTQQYYAVPNPQATSGQTWNDISGTLYDALDRPTNKLSYSPGNTAVSNTQLAYDASTSSSGFLSSKLNPVGETATYTYDAFGDVSQVSYTGDGGVTPTRTITRDANGRDASDTFSTVGTQLKSFDLDGRVTQVQEPANGGVSAPATIQYTYYADGSKKSVGVASAPAPLSGSQTLLTYSYRADGVLTNTSEPIYSQVFNYSYTAAGRMASRTDSATGTSFNFSSGTGSSKVSGTVSFVAESKSYSKGMLSSHTFPNGGVENNFTYDGEGEVTGYAITQPSYECPAPANMPCQFAGSATYGYSTRATLTDIASVNSGSNCAGSQNCQQFPYNDGHRTVRGFDADITCQYLYFTESSNYCSYDVVTGAALQTNSITGKCTGSEALRVLTYSFDAAGRKSSVTTTSPNSATCGNSGTGTNTFSYDAENRLLQFASNTPTVWGPNGHPVITGIPYYNYTLHWDGDTLLYVTDSKGNLVQLNVGADAQIVAPSTASTTTAPISAQGVQIQARDTSGTSVLNYNSTYLSPWTAINTPAGIDKSVYGDSTIESSTTSYTPGFLYISQQRLDSYQPNGTTFAFQGSRMYDSGSNQFMSPDGGGGSASDPNSQLPYFWNNANPMMDLDFTGNYPCNVNGALLVSGDPQGGGGSQSGSSGNSQVLDLTSAQCRALGGIPELVAEKVQANSFTQYLLMDSFGEHEDILGEELNESRKIGLAYAGVFPIFVPGLGEEEIGAGIYEFTAVDGKLYIGQTKDILRRLAEHMKSGKLVETYKDSIRFFRVSGNKLDREIAEQTAINAAGGVEKLANIRNAMGLQRQQQFNIPPPKF